MWQDGRLAGDQQRWLLAPLSAPPGNAGAAPSKVLCNCLNVSEAKVRAGIAKGLDLTDLKQALGCGTSCGSCVPEIKRLLATRPVAQTL